MTADAFKRFCETQDIHEMIEAYVEMQKGVQPALPSGECGHLVEKGILRDRLDTNMTRSKMPIHTSTSVGTTMSNCRLDPATVAQQISNLLLTNPELADDDVLRADMIEGETDAFEFLRKVEMIREDTVDLIEGIAERTATLQERAHRLNRREQAMRSLMFKIMSAADLRKIELPEATLSIRNGTQKVIITDVLAIPDELFVIRQEPNKMKIRVLLGEGKTVPGAELSNAEPVLNIRTK